MKLPSITATYVAVLVLLYATLSLAGTLQFQVCRVGGMVITTLVMITCSLLILLRPLASR